MARKLFLVSAGMLMFALSYHAGAQTAGAQGANALCAAAVYTYTNEEYAVASSGVLYERLNGPWSPIRTIPVTSKPVSLLAYASPTTGSGDRQFTLFTEDGTVFTWLNWDGPIATSNVFGGGPVPARRETWGQVKSRYAPARGTARSGAGNR